MREITKREMQRLHAALEGVEAHEHWNEGTALRVNILKFYGWNGLRLIETYEPSLAPAKRRPSMWDGMPGNREWASQLFSMRPSQGWSSGIERTPQACEDAVTLVFRGGAVDEWTPARRLTRREIDGYLESMF